MTSLYHVKHAGWISVTNEIDIDWDLENNPLEIKTNSSLGIDKHLVLNFHTDLDFFYAGGFYVKFTSTPQYQLPLCTPWTNFPITLPAATDKIWRVTVDRSAGIRVLIHCNGEPLLNVLLSDQICALNSFGWRAYWNRDATKIYFNRRDTASHYYRSYTGKLDIPFRYFDCINCLTLRHNLSPEVFRICPTLAHSTI